MIIQTKCGFHGSSFRIFLSDFPLCVSLRGVVERYSIPSSDDTPSPSLAFSLLHTLHFTLSSDSDF